MQSVSETRSEPSILERLGGEGGCKRLSIDFYQRVANHAVLKPLFPGKSLRCAQEEFAAFLVQFLGGDPDQTQYRWWLSLRESHARFKISEPQRLAWLALMGETIDVLSAEEPSLRSLTQFFEAVSLYVVGQESETPHHPELAARWQDQLALDALILAITEGHDAVAIRLAQQFSTKPHISVGIFARFMKTGCVELEQYVLERLDLDPKVANGQFFGRTLIHYAAASGCLAVTQKLLDQGADPNALDRERHTPLYRLANECGSKEGAAVVRALVAAGADVNQQSGVNRVTPLHAAARYGHLASAEALLECGASLTVRDQKGHTPADRARNCRQAEMVELLQSQE